MILRVIPPACQVEEVGGTLKQSLGVGGEDGEGAGGVEGIQRIRVFGRGVKAQGGCLTPWPSTEY